MEERNKLQSINNALQAKVDVLTNENNSLANQIDQLKMTIDTLENHLLPESESQLEAAKRELNHHKEIAGNASNMIPEYEEKIRNLNEELKATRLESETERLAFQKLNKESGLKYSQVFAEFEAQQAEFVQLQMRLKEVTIALEKKTQELSDAREQLKELEMSSRRRIDELHQLLKVTETKLESSQVENADIKQTISDAFRLIQSDPKNQTNELFRNNGATALMEEMVAQRIKMQLQLQELEKQLATTEHERDDARSRLATFDAREEELFMKLSEGERVRRELHNRVIQLSGNIRVYVRVRPVLPGEDSVTSEISLGFEHVKSDRKRKHAELEERVLFRYPDIYDSCAKKASAGSDDITKNIIEVTEPYKDRGGLSDRRKHWRFGFDRVFHPEHSQQDIWEATEPLVQSAIDGYNVTIFAYGQTGSGKTYTMLGEKDSEGIIFRSVRKIFQAKNEIESLSRGEAKVDIAVELLEIYNDQVRDLLAPNGGPDGREVSLKVTSKEVVGSILVAAENENHVHKILAKAQRRRCVKATASNEVSSRSHMLFTLHFKVSSCAGVSKSGKLHVCDLAGSERLSKSNANAHAGGALLSETKHINSSLSVLSKVIEKLQAGEKNIPFRESKLTYLLQNSLGGNSKTLAIVCCNPLESHYHESLCSLRFGEKCTKVDLKSIANFSC